MKPTQSSKSVASASSSPKSKKGSKDREKRKSQTSSTDSSNEKGSPSKECKQYAGISADTLRVYADSIPFYAEQTVHQHLSKGVCDLLTEDINYKLRYIIHEALLKARLSGRDAITSKDIDETFDTLSIERVYGAPSNPVWVPFGDQNFMYLDDKKINLVELAEEDTIYAQPGTVVLERTWFPDAKSAEPNEALKTYFCTVCQSLISNDDELRKMALQDISENAHIGPIMEWFYHFGYFLLMKDITYDCLTLRALELIETLENSPLGRTNISEKQLKLLVRLLLQRLLMSNSTKEVLKSMCSVLAVLCLREPLKEMVITKINQKITGIHHQTALPLLMTIYFLGIDAVRYIFLPNMTYFLSRVVGEEEPELPYVTLAIYGLICKANDNWAFIHESFKELFYDILILYWPPHIFKITDKEKKGPLKKLCKMKCLERSGEIKFSLEEVFDIPRHDCKIRKKINEHSRSYQQVKKETHVIVGKTVLLLPEFKNSRNISYVDFCHHSLLSYNF